MNKKLKRQREEFDRWNEKACVIMKTLAGDDDERLLKLGDYMTPLTLAIGVALAGYHAPPDEEFYDGLRKGVDFAYRLYVEKSVDA